MTLIDIGTNVMTGKPQYWNEIHQFGVHIIGAKARFGKCLSGDSKIRIEDGSFISIEELYKNYEHKRIISCNKDTFGLEFNYIKDMVKRKTDENDKILKIKTKGNHSITVTDKHNMFIWNNGFIEKKASELKNGDYLISFRKSGIDNKKELIKDCEIILLGYILGDGAIKKNRITFTNQDNEMLDDYIENATRCGFDDIKEFKYKGKSAFDVYLNSELGKGNYFVYGKENYQEVTDKINKVKLFCKKFDLELGLNSYTKYVPQIVFKTSNEQKAIFLNRLFSCDGHVNRHILQIEYSSNSFRLINGMIQLLLDLGIDSKVKEEFKCAVVKGVRGRKIKTYRLFIGGIDNLTKFDDLISFVSNKKFFDLRDIIMEKHKKGNAINEMIPNINDDLKIIFDDLKPIKRHIHGSSEIIGFREYLRNDRTPSRYALKDRFNFMKNIRPKIIESKSYKNINKLIDSDLIFYKIEQINEVDKEKYEFVYDLEIENNHNLFVGDTTQFLIHNSVLAKNIMIAVAESRRLLIIDYQGEHKTMMYPNFFGGTKYIRSIPDLVVIENLGFLISDFDRTTDWLSLGFPEGSSNLMSLLASHTEVHGNDPLLFYSVLQDLPNTSDDVESFVVKYPTLGIDNKVNSATKDSTITRFRFIMNRGLFCTYDDIQSGDKNYIDDYYGLMESNKHVLIDLDLSGSMDAYIGRAYVGKILERLASPPQKMKKLNLAIFIEEADIIFPSSSVNALSSVGWMVNYVLKYQKYWVELFFVVQDLNNLQEDIVKSFHTMFLGIVPMYGITWEFKDIINSLKWDYVNNYREFVMITAGDLKMSKKNIFSPNMSSCIT